MGCGSSTSATVVEHQNQQPARPGPSKPQPQPHQPFLELYKAKKKDGNIIRGSYSNRDDDSDTQSSVFTTSLRSSVKHKGKHDQDDEYVNEHDDPDLEEQHTESPVHGRPSSEASTILPPQRGRKRGVEVATQTEQPAADPVPEPRQTSSPVPEHQSPDPSIPSSESISCPESSSEDDDQPVGGMEPSAGMAIPTTESPGPIPPPKTPLILEPPEFQPRLEFPSVTILREANKQHARDNRGKPLVSDEDTGVLVPYPPPKLKEDIFNPQHFLKIDARATQAPSSLNKGSLEVLVEYLCKPAKTDLEKVRGIFRWITSQDLTCLDDDPEAENGTVLSYLLKLKVDKIGYSTIFVEMCLAAGVQAKKIEGIVRTSTYDPTVDTPEEDAKSTWAAVLIDQVWWLCDPHWGARGTTGGGFGDWVLIDDNGKGVTALKEEQEKIKYQINEAYFLINPEEMIYSHFPTLGEEWQLLARPVSKKEFHEMASLTTNFFNLNLQILNHPKGLLQAPEGEIEILFGLPKTRRRFMYRLWMSVKEKDQDVIGDLKLVRFVFMEQIEDFLKVTIFFPTDGLFKLELFAKDFEEVSKDSHRSYRKVCTYYIKSGKAKEDVKPLPENQRIEWGPGQDLEKVGMRPQSHRGATIEADDGTVQIRLESRKDVKLLHTMHSNTKTDEELDDYVVHQVENHEAVIHVKLPEPGEYALNVYAKEEGEEGNYPSVCSYLITSDQSAFDPSPFPAVTNGALGVTDIGRSLGVSCESHEESFIHALDCDEIEIEIKSETPCDFSSSLKYQDNKETQTIDEYLFLTSRDESRASLSIRPPKAGTYKLEVFGKDKQAEGTTHPKIYNFMIEVPTPTKNCKSFPKSYSLFQSNNCRLESPLSGVLPSNQKIEFAAHVPHALRVAVISSEGWTQLDQDEDDVWKAEVETGQPETILKLAAKMSEESNTYQHLLVYEVKHPTEIIQQQQKQRCFAKSAKERQREEKTRHQERVKDFDKTRAELRQAIEDRDEPRLRMLLSYISKRCFTTGMGEDLSAAKKLLESLHHLKALCQSVDDYAMAEIRGYKHPPKLVHEVMMACLVLLGVDESNLQTWGQCLQRFNQMDHGGLLRRMREFHVDDIRPETPNQARRLLSPYRRDDVMDTSTGAGILYAWAVGASQEAYNISRATPSQGRYDLLVIDEEDQSSGNSNEESADHLHAQDDEDVDDFDF